MSHQLHFFFLWIKLLWRLNPFFYGTLWSCGWVSRALPQHRWLYNNAAWLDIMAVSIFCARHNEGPAPWESHRKGINSSDRQVRAGFEVGLVCRTLRHVGMFLMWFSFDMLLGCVWCQVALKRKKKKQNFPPPPGTSQTQSKVRGGQRRRRACVCCQQRKKCTPAVITHTHTHTHTHTQRRSRRTGCILYDTKIFCLAGLENVRESKLYVRPLVVEKLATDDEPTFQRIPNVYFPLLSFRERGSSYSQFKHPDSSQIGERLLGNRTEEDLWSVTMRKVLVVDFLLSYSGFLNMRGEPRLLPVEVGEPHLASPSRIFKCVLHCHDHKTQVQ